TFQATELRPGIELLLTVGAMFAWDAAAPRQPIPVQNRHPQTVPLPRRRVTPAGHARPCRPDRCRSGRRPRYVAVYFWALRLHSRKAAARAALMCCSLRCAKLGDASAETERASPRAIVAIRLFPIVTVSLLDSKSLPIHKPA